MFLNKDVLDIGCNDGSITLMIATKYFPKRIVGIDIDYRLVNKAIDNFNQIEQQPQYRKNTQIQKLKNEDLEKTQELMERLSKLPQSFLLNI